jgi:hypothetical protein
MWILYASIKRSVKISFFFFRCDVKALEDSLCKRVIVTRDETITKWLDPESAAISRDALAKIVYSRLFDWYASFPCLEEIFLLDCACCISFTLFNFIK